MDRRFPSGLAFVSACLLVLAFSSFAQEEAPLHRPPPLPRLPIRHPRMLRTATRKDPQVQTGTRFLVSLQEALSTAVDKRGKRFTLRTLEPLVTLDGTRLPAGAEIRARVSRVDAPNQTGRGRLWLTFDDIHAPGGPIPIVADLFDIPSDRIGKGGKKPRRAKWKTRNNPATEQAEAAAGAAAMAAFTAAKTGGKKGAALGAAAAGVTAFLLASGSGQDVVLDKETKLELILERPLTLPAR
jgi:hypothetical protein